MLLIVWLLACGFCWEFGHQAHDWAPLAIVAIGGPVIIWMYRHDWL